MKRYVDFCGVFFCMLPLAIRSSAFFWTGGEGGALTFLEVLRRTLLSLRILLHAYIQST